MSGFPNKIVKVRAGQSVDAYATFILPTTLNLTGMSIEYQLVDTSGAIYLDVDNAIVTDVSAFSDTHTSVKAQDSLTIPETLPVADEFGTKYVIIWTLRLADGSAHTYTEVFDVSPVVEQDTGPQSVVAFKQQSTPVTAVLPVDGSVDLAIYAPNNDTAIITQASLTKTSDAYSGYVYSHTLDLPNLSTLTPSFDPYTGIWTYTENSIPQNEPFSLWVLNPQMMQAMKDMTVYIRHIMNDTRVDDLAVNEADIAEFLRGGRDDWNARFKITNMSMIRAEAGIRMTWLQCSQIQMLRALYLAEGMRSFNFSGQQVTFDVDVTQYISTVISELESSLENTLRPLKEENARRGIHSGDGRVNWGGKVHAGVGIQTGPASGLNHYPWRHT